MRLLMLLPILLYVQASAALEYKVGVVFPYGESEPKNRTFNTNKDQRTNKIELKNSKFSCETDVYDGLGEGKVFSLRLKCRSQVSDQIFVSNATCAEDLKIKPGFDILVSLEEATATSKREHKITVECHPGKKSLVESGLKPKK